MKAQPITLDALVAGLITRIDHLDPGAAPRPRVAVDGPASAFGADLADRGPPTLTLWGRGDD